MRISFSTAALFPKRTIDALKILENAGYEYAELMPQCRHETKPRFALEILKETSVRVASIHFPLVFFSTLYNPYPGMVKEFKELADDLIAAGGILESEIIVVHPLHITDGTVKDVFEKAILENLRYLCENASRFGIKVVLENSPKSGRTPDEMRNWAEKIGHENLYFMVDTTEAVESDQDPIELIKALKPVHIHASDHSKSEKHIPPGEGDMDWKGLIGTLKDMEYPGLIVVEPSYRYFLENAIDKLIEIREFLEGLV